METLVLLFGSVFLTLSFEFFIAFVTPRILQFTAHAKEDGHKIVIQSLGVFSIRNGCFVACIIQILLGVLVWGTLKYLRPMLEVFNIMAMVYFIAGALLGLYAIWTRSELLTWLYLIHLGSCATIIFLLAMDFSGILHILPKPPVAPSVPIKPPIVQKFEKLEAAISEKAAKALENPFATAPTTTKAFLMRVPIQGFSFRNILPHFHEGNDLMNHLWSRKNANTEQIRPLYKNTNLISPSLLLLNSKKELLNQKSLNPDEEVLVDEPSKMPDPAQNVVPQLHQSEGQSEEVSRDELPPEVKQLPKNMQQQVSATTKVIKHVIKFFFSGIYATLFVFQIYCTYIVFTFALNKCTSLDELTEQPEQFQPIMQAGSSDTVFSQISVAP